MLPGHAQGDLRTRRTRLALREALLALVEEKGFDAIVVQDLADRAMINRVTFYKHYRDKYDLLERTMQEMLGELAAPVETLLQQPGDPAIADALVLWLEQAARYRGFYRTMLGRGGNAAFAAQLRDYLEAMVTRIIAATPGAAPIPEPQRSIALRFLAAGFLGVTEWWLEQSQPLAARDVALHLHRLLQTVVSHAPTS